MLYIFQNLQKFDLVIATPITETVKKKMNFRIGKKSNCKRNRNLNRCRSHKHASHTAAKHTTIGSSQCHTQSACAAACVTVLCQQKWTRKRYYLKPTLFQQKCLMVSSFTEHGGTYYNVGAPYYLQCICRTIFKISRNITTWFFSLATCESDTGNVTIQTKKIIRTS